MKEKKREFTREEREEIGKREDLGTEGEW